MFEPQNESARLWLTSRALVSLPSLRSSERNGLIPEVIDRTTRLRRDLPNYSSVAAAAARESAAIEIARRISDRTSVGIAPGISIEAVQHG